MKDRQEEKNTLSDSDSDVSEEPQRPNRFKVFFDSDEDEKSSTKQSSYQYKEHRVGKKRESPSDLSSNISIQKNTSQSSASRKSSQSAYENQSIKRILCLTQIENKNKTYF
jgi:hypothetical protein